jgi:hypothetical protein
MCATHVGWTWVCIPMNLQSVVSLSFNKYAQHVSASPSSWDFAAQCAQLSHTSCTIDIGHGKNTAMTKKKQLGTVDWKHAWKHPYGSSILEYQGGRIRA